MGGGREISCFGRQAGRHAIIVTIIIIHNIIYITFTITIVIVNIIIIIIDTINTINIIINITYVWPPGRRHADLQAHLLRRPRRRRGRQLNDMI